MNRIEAIEAPTRVSDGALLSRFHTKRDNSAFAELVARHGPMVFGVCLRRLGQCADAEDAFQAVFLALASQAATLSGRANLGPWLYTVARRVSGKALRSRRRRRWLFWSRSPDLPTAAPAEVDVDLDAALATLSEQERSAIILCHLEGLSRSEAAKALGCPEGTLSARLSRGLDKLRQKLGKPPLAVLVAASLVMLPDELPASTVDLVHHHRNGTLDDWASPGTLDLYRRADPMRYLHRAGPVVAAFAAVGLIMVGVSFGWNLIEAQDKPANEKAKVIDDRGRGTDSGGVLGPRGGSGSDDRVGSGSLIQGMLGGEIRVGGADVSGGRSSLHSDWRGPNATTSAVLDDGRLYGGGGGTTRGFEIGERSLADAVKKFNDWAKTDAVGKTQPPLTEDEVVAAMLMQRNLRVAGNYALEDFAKNRVIPNSWGFRALDHIASDPYLFDVWIVDLRISKANEDFHPLRIRDQRIRARPLKPAVEKKNFVYRLKNGSAENVVNLLKQTVNSSDVSVAADVATNSIIVSASSTAKYESVLKVIQAIDALKDDPSPQSRK